MDDARHMRGALKFAEEHGKCRRRKIACVLVNAEGVEMAGGANGPPGWSCLDKPCPDADVPAGDGAYRRVRCHGIHAEVDALIDLKSEPYPIDDIHTIYCTKAPCLACAEMLLMTPAQRLVFAVWPNDKSGLEAWSDAGRAYSCLGDG